MGESRRKWSKELKLKILSQRSAGRSVTQLSREYDVAPTQIYLWEKQVSKYGEKAFAGNGKLYTDEAYIASLERKLAQSVMEIDLLKKACASLQSACLEGKPKGGKS